MSLFMDGLAQALFYAAFAGATIPLGAFLARIERIRPKWLEQEFRHAVLAFGGGILVGAVALVLVPEGERIARARRACRLRRSCSSPPAGFFI